MMSEQQAKPVNDPKAKPVDVLQEFLTALADDPWMDGRIKQHVQAALKHYEAAPQDKKAEAAQ